MVMQVGWSLDSKCDCGKPMCDAFRRPYRQNADERADHAMRASNTQVHRPLALSWPTIMARHIWPIPSGPPKAKCLRNLEIILSDDSSSDSPSVGLSHWGTSRRTQQGARACTRRMGCYHG